MQGARREVWLFPINDEQRGTAPFGTQPIRTVPLLARYGVATRLRAKSTLRWRRLVSRQKSRRSEALLADKRLWFNDCVKTSESCSTVTRRRARRSRSARRIPVCTRCCIFACVFCFGSWVSFGLRALFSLLCVGS